MDSNFRALCQESFLDCRLSYTILFCIGSVLNSVVIQKQVKYVVNKTAAFLQLFFFAMPHSHIVAKRLAYEYSMGRSFQKKVSTIQLIHTTCRCVSKCPKITNTQNTFN